MIPHIPKIVTFSPEEINIIENGNKSILSRTTLTKLPNTTN